MDYYKKLAKELHKRDAKKKIGPCVGTVLQTTPMKVSICDGAVVLEQGECALLSKRVADMTIEKGDRIICLPCEGEQTWIFLDKAVS